ncbi:uncharacterized protein ANIA_11257 [Aspergillus nidulans FGSC A4]|uniref:Uncharacterized protein n=1 Tax=Emericella nidulans (strain FGSC A4 / ATCC 38163 / CBS 112.46 / NRRL 194 / M139) TaxID=227321 RepID=C8VRH3_EMENI|nr:hypothetical protein [Aspergillus nidulans FGSC A4]CBF90378.1 TPA: hypothetical protein ANIA_11257 [Aspergillus nidulans FGSC A4]
MQILSTTLTVMSLMSAVTANTIVRWHGCSGEYQETQTTGDGCTNVSGFKTENLCSVEVPPPGTDRCEFYSTACDVMPSGRNTAPDRRSKAIR